jgi:hypothetical protein
MSNMTLKQKKGAIILSAEDKAAAALEAARKLASEELGNDQLDLIEEIATTIRSHAEALEEARAHLTMIAAALFPAPAPLAAWNAAMAYIGFTADRLGVNPEHAKNSIRKAYRALHGKLPSKKGGQISVKRTLRGATTRLAETIEALAKSKSEISAKRLADITAALNRALLLIRAEQKDQKAA